jgi:RHS repeat-associated protein
MRDPVWRIGDGGGNHELSLRPSNGDYNEVGRMMRARHIPLLAALVTAIIMPGAALAADVVTYYHLDAIGNVREVTNQAGQAVERHDYLPFGEECTTGPCASNPGVGAGQPKKFTGKERDNETGLDYFGARYYGSKIARFTTTDPVYTWKENLVDPQRWNRYAYGRNNPLRYTDPDGKKIILAPGSSDTFKAEFARTITYLNTGKVGGLIAELEARPEVITVKEGISLTDFAYSPGTRTITYNPNSATNTTEGGSQSPALGFLHEADHALQSVKNPEKFRRARTTPDPVFDSAEEKRVITGSEARAARKLGEDARRDHKTYEYRVPNADTRTPE